MDALRLNVDGLDYALLAIYFVTVLGIGWIVRKSVRTTEDFFLSGRSLPAWVTGLAFVSANLGATEVLGQAANGAEYGVMTVHYYWVGAVPAMVFLAVFMMPFYYGTKVGSVPEFVGRRFNAPAQVLSSITFAVAQILIAGINLYALALVVEAMLGWPQWVAIIVAGAFVLAYITLGGLSSAIYNEVLQFFVIIVALIPVVALALDHIGGISGLKRGINHTVLGNPGLHAWRNTGFGSHNPMEASWLGIILGLGFVLGFGYWTTNFAEIQRALSANNMSAARRTPIIAAFPKLLLPAITVLPGMIALILVKGLGTTYQYNDAIPLLIRDFLPNGVLGLALTGLLASFMAGMAANVSAFNTVLTTDLWRPYITKDRPDAYYLRLGRLFTVVGVVLGVGTAFLAAGFSNLMNYMQSLFSFFNAPLFAVFIIGLLWKRMGGWAGFWSLLMGTVGAIVAYILYETGAVNMGSAINSTFIIAIVAFVTALVTAVIVTLITAPPDVAKLAGYVWGTQPIKGGYFSIEGGWYRSPAILGAIVVLIGIGLDILVF
ncbi:MAG: sodium:solute symporter family protein [Streptosporangiaceae bacterium]